MTNCPDDHVYSRLLKLEQYMNDTVETFAAILARLGRCEVALTKLAEVKSDKEYVKEVASLANELSFRITSCGQNFERNR